MFTMQWTEENGPKVSAPHKKGFGSLVTGPIVESALGGEVEMEFLEGGVRWTLSAAVEEAVESR